MSERVHVGSTDELEPGDRKIVSTARGEVGVFNLDGEYTALLNRCVHQGGPACQGRLTKEIEGEYTGLGERVEERYSDRAVVKCPWHGWEYFVDSGELVGDTSIALPTFDVVVEGDDLYLEV